jgi:hypothetical protein
MGSSSVAVVLDTMVALGSAALTKVSRLLCLRTALLYFTLPHLTSPHIRVLALLRVFSLGIYLLGTGLGKKIGGRSWGFQPGPE